MTETDEMKLEVLKIIMEVFPNPTLTAGKRIKADEAAKLNAAIILTQKIAEIVRIEANSKIEGKITGEALRYCLQGMWIYAIKELRHMHMIGLQDAKDMIDAWRQQNPKVETWHHNPW